VALRAEGTRYDSLASLGDDLRFVLITSKATVARETGTAVTVTPSAHPKCERCWHYRADVGADPAHPGLCGRCVSNLFGPGEPRAHA
jgi:isoleucyl-tRNA synthetase